MELLQTVSHDAKNTAAEHLEAFYTTFDEVRDEHFDGLIITGAPVEKLDFEEVDYWPELCEIMECSKTHVHSVFPHEVVKRTSPLVRGFDDEFFAPHSRFTEVCAADIEAHPELELIAVSDEAGVYVAKSIDSQNFFVFGHPEYDRETLKAEYDRDVARGMAMALPPRAHRGEAAAEPGGSREGEGGGERGSRRRGWDCQGWREDGRRS